MGNSHSSKNADEGPGNEEFIKFKDKIKVGIDDEISRRMMTQREINMSLDIARARDNLQIFGTLYTAFLTPLGLAKLIRKPVHPFFGVPVVVGGVMLGNLFDFAYGNKLSRINKEAQYILENERARLVPFKQASFSKFYTDEERSALFDSSTAVGDLWPTNTFSRKLLATPDSKLTQRETK